MASNFIFSFDFVSWEHWIIQDVFILIFIYETLNHSTGIPHCNTLYYFWYSSCCWPIVLTLLFQNQKRSIVEQMKKKRKNVTQSIQTEYMRSYLMFINNNNSSGGKHRISFWCRNTYGECFGIKILYKMRPHFLCIWQWNKNESFIRREQILWHRKWILHFVRANIFPSTLKCGN